MEDTAAPGRSERLIHTEPTKDFFLTMITRDISLSDCIFDLLDNAIDGARRQQAKSGAPTLAGYRAQIELSRDGFIISDNCGGISLADAIDYAFHFGRKPDAPKDVSQGIGLYGIGMKRAIFKMGRSATIDSETEADSFRVSVDVDTWEKAKDWDFHYEDKIRSGDAGTKVIVTNLYQAVADTFSDRVFLNELVKLIARDYAFFLANDFEIRVAEILVPTYRYDLKSGGDLLPALIEYEDGEVSVRIAAGLIDDLSDEVPDELKPEKVERYGWFVVCNDRVVLAADKTERTVWGNDGFKVWHPQYNGFAGFVFFTANDPKKLPWTTTKREVDISDPLYRRTLLNLKNITEDFTKYTNQRKADLEMAKMAERIAKPVNIATLPTRSIMSFPKVGEGAQHPRVEYVTISYQKPKIEIQEIKDSLNRSNMTAKDVGKYTFDHFRRVELGK